jgi:hypothetical protein
MPSHDTPDQIKDLITLIEAVDVNAILLPFHTTTVYSDLCPFLILLMPWAWVTHDSLTRMW